MLSCLLSAIRKLKESVGTASLEEPSLEPAARLRQLSTIKAAYESLKGQEPQLPGPGSPIQELLALRSAQNLADETRASTTTIQSQLRQSQGLLKQEKAHLRDGRQITAGLQGRLESMRREEHARSQMTREESAAEVLQSLKTRRKTYNREVKRLIQAFNWFIETHLAPMLATEEQGGPVVGEALDIDEEALRRTLAPRQRERGVDDSRANDSDEDDDAVNVVDAAELEMRTLTENLLNASISGETGSNAYVNLKRDSAAVRFLVRAKIAQFSPRDARKLRLVDFGRRLDD